jgi:hypothetical protein
MRALGLAVVVCVVAGSASVARADDREDARKEFTAGKAADTAGDLTGAIKHYTLAFDLIPHPNAAYNIAFDNDQLGNNREAAKWYQQFLDLAPTAPEAGRIRILINELKRRPGPLTVTSTPSGTQVLVDGRLLVTPVTVQVAGGNHMVVLEPNGQRELRKVHTEYGEPQSFAFEPRGGGQAPQQETPGRQEPPGPGQGTLLVYGSPPGATVYVDDQPAGQLPAQLQVPTGKHTVRVQQAGYSDAFATVDVAASGVTREQIELTRGLGSSGPPSASGPGGGPGATQPAPTPTGLLFGYLLGVSGGLDARSTDAAYTADLGVRVSRWELLAQIGQAEGGTYFNFALRASLTTGRFAPFLGASYQLLDSANSGDATTTSSSSSGGFSGLAGVRWDFARSDRLTLTARATVGVGYFNVTETNSMTGATTTSTQISVPVTLSLEAVIGRTQ